MKKIILPLALIILTTACAPKDLEVIAKGQRDKFNQGKSSNTAEAKSLKIGSFGVATFAMEKQGEILQILSTSNLLRHQVSGPYIVDEATDEKQVFQEIVLSAIDHQTTTPNYLFVQNSKWNSLVKRDEDHGVVAIFARSVADGGNTQSATLKENTQLKEQGATLTETSANLIVSRAEDDVFSIDISYSAVGTLEAKIEGISEVMPYDMRIKMRVKTAQLQTAQIEITSSEVALKLARVKFPVDITLKSVDGEAMTFKNDKDCPTLIGKALFASEKAKKFVVYNDIDATVVDGNNGKVLYKSIHVACKGQRPTVDLTRLLFWD